MYHANADKPPSACCSLRHGMSLSIILFACCSTTFALDIHVIALSRDFAILLLDGERQVMRVGDFPVKGITLLKADSEQATLLIKDQPQIYKLSEQNYVMPSVPKSDTTALVNDAPVRIYPDDSGLYRVYGQINGVAVPMIVDTGASTVAMSSQQALQLNFICENSQWQGTVETASGTASACQVILDNISVGHITLKGIKAVVIEGKYPTSALLGMNFLQQLDMQRSGKLLELRQRQ